MQRGALAVGVIGHVDHGKTALVRALTGMETDRLAEEKRRGISIALGFAHFRAGDAVLDLIDMPGHERFVRTMIAGATGMRAVLLVVAANEGVRPQTVEHAEIAGLLGVRDAVIAVNKCDAAAPEAIAAARYEAEALARRCGLRAGPAHAASALTGAGVAALRAALGDLAREARRPPDRGLAYLPIDRAFTVAGHGTVVTGTLRGAPVAPGDELEIVPGGRRVRVRGVQMRGAPAPLAQPGQRAALNLRGIDRAEAGRGLALATPGLLAPSGWLTVTLRAAPSAPAPLPAGTRLRLLYGTAETEAVVRLLDRAELPPGEACLAQLRCAPRAALPAGEPFVLRQPSPPLAIAGGRVLDPMAWRLRRSDPATLEWLTRLAREAPPAIVAAAVERAGTCGTAVLEVARLAGVSVPNAETALRAHGAVLVQGHAVTRPALAQARARVLRVLASAPAGVARERLGALLPDCGGPVLDMALAGLAASGRVGRAGGKLRALHAVDEARRREDAASLAARLAETFRRAGLAPPTEPPTDAFTRAALERLVRAGLLVRTYDRVQKREVLFHRDALDEARRRLIASLGQGATVSEIGSALGTTRKYSVPLLEYFDAVQVTRRMGDRRVLRQAAELPELPLRPLGRRGLG